MYLTFGAAVVWFALVLQFIVSLKAAEYDFLSTTELYLSFFTITTNITVAICLTTIILFSKTKLGVFFSQPSTQTAITVYIVVVGIIYNVLLRGLLSPVGWARVADELLHVVNPLIFLGFWMLFVNKQTLQYKAAFVWLLYPLAYIMFIVIRGYLINQYPYPFINVVDLGYPKALANAFGCLFLFWILSLLLIWVGKKLAKR
ncbi:Pr6Pr family membrane protein [Pedobacter sp. MC2016-05]|uniref:Pr6Pr family membrane protein n=1 Tax=Pedobacter sp. MC2016-05 TaxID=2994474 RepID=UPI0022455ACD|nr:Pr6Pr family membrane protein [Pedobacter sp. MC2016-05]MCX2475433.1 Pr6Pr family membrane protein [Pedobacter sp. MC2016-05]